MSETAELIERLKREARVVVQVLENGSEVVRHDPTKLQAARRLTALQEENDRLRDVLKLARADLVTWLYRETNASPDTDDTIREVDTALSLKKEEPSC
jgi:hypothetical protein